MIALIAAAVLGAAPLPDGVFVERPASKRDLKPGAAQCISIEPQGFRGVTSAADRFERCYGIFTSQALDPTGEVTHGGYWLFVGSGEIWDDGTYLDLREHEPFVVIEGSRLWVSEDGVLRLVVRREPIDKKKLTLPQTRVPVSESSEPLVLEARLADLRRDSDGDTLSDLEERRLFLDWNDRDSDHDGIEDDRDPMPNMPRGATPTLLAAYFNRMLPVVLGRRPAPVMAAPPRGVYDDDPFVFKPGEYGRTTPTDVVFLVANRAAIAGLRSDRRLVVVEPDECREASKRFGMSCGISVDVKQRDDGSYWITWWGGFWEREFRAKLVDGGWQLDDMGETVY
ncbi:MAG: hypothetical protein ACAI38_19030 [Myxococcota bacterium]